MTWPLGSNSRSGDVTKAKNLFNKLYKSEKRVMLDLGLAPKKKDRTGTLLYYVESLYPSEQEELIDLINRHTDLNLHEGSLPFLNRNLALEVLAHIKDGGWPNRGTITGRSADLLITDDLSDSSKVNWKEIEASKTFRAKGTMHTLAGNYRPKQGKR